MKPKKQNLALGASAVSAIAASLCCIGPLVTVVLGLGGFAGASFFAKWRPVMLLVTFALLALGWYLTYRTPKNACSEDDLCAAKPTGKWNRVVLWLATAFVVGTALFPVFSAAIVRSAQPTRAQPAIAPENLATLKVRIPTMDCEACAVSIQTKLQKQSGIQSAQVRFDTKEAVVQYDATKLSSQAIIAAIDQTGFKAEPTTRKEKP